MQRHGLRFIPVNRLICWKGLCFFVFLLPTDSGKLVHSADARIHSKLNDDQKNLLKEYGASFQKLEDFYGSNIETHVRHTIVKLENDKESVIVDCDISLYMREGTYGRLDIRRKPSGNTGSAASEDVSLLTLNHFYRFKRSGDSAYLLGTKGDAKDELGMIKANAPFATCSYMSNGVTFEEVLLKDEIRLGFKHSPNYHVTDVHEILNGNDSVIRVTTLATGTAGRDFPVEYAFYREKQWALKNLQEEVIIDAPRDASGKIDLSGPRHKRITELEYEGESNGVPLIKRLTQTVYTPEGKLESKTIYDVTKIVPGPPPLSVFDPKQFLPPETIVKLERAQLSWGRLPFAFYRVSATRLR